MHIEDVIDVLDRITSQCYTTAMMKGWWDSNRGIPECIALIHSELSEALEYHRMGRVPDDHLPEFDGLTVELADVIIRVFDLAGRHKLKLSEALLAKMAYNESRPVKHGGKVC